MCEAFAKFTDWATRYKKIHDRIIVLINEIVRDLFKGIGKPEPLKHEFKGWWSRRITNEHRLIYKVIDTEIMILSCYSHYEN